MGKCYPLFIKFGLINSEARQSRWISRDPIGERGGANRYSFCENGVVYSLDPVGLNKTVLRKEAHTYSVVKEEVVTGKILKPLKELSPVPLENPLSPEGSTSWINWGGNKILGFFGVVGKSLSELTDITDFADAVGSSADYVVGAKSGLGELAKAQAVTMKGGTDERVNSDDVYQEVQDDYVVVSDKIVQRAPAGYWTEEVTGKMGLTIKATGYYPYFREFTYGCEE